MSILNKTFKAELVAQDENDEPAEVLLELVKKSRRDEIIIEKIFSPSIFNPERVI